MDVFLVPLGADDYEPYTEEADEPEDDREEERAPAGFFPRLRFFLSPSRIASRLKLKFTRMLAAAERERRRDAALRAADGRWARVKSKPMRWVAESIAEQRLLWHLRRVTDARLLYPDDISEDNAHTVLRKQLSSDFEKHRLWLAIDSVLMVLSAALILLPGPNVAGYYFAFRVVGHYFSVRGARNGLSDVRWTYTPSAPLAELRPLASVDPAARLERVEQVAARLNLDHFATFFQRISVRTP